MLCVSDLRRLTVGPITLEVPLGRFAVLMGPSGAGKSLLLRAIADLDPHEGTVSLDGVPQDALPAPRWRRHVPYIATDAGWWDEDVGGHFPDHRGAAALLPPLGLPEDALTWPVSRASTGERQRLALARGLTLPRDEDARVYLLDEPTSGLDAEATAKTETVLRSLPDARTAVLMVSHDPAQARRLADLRLELTDGRVRDVTVETAS